MGVQRAQSAQWQVNKYMVGCITERFDVEEAHGLCDLFLNLILIHTQAAFLLLHCFITILLFWPSISESCCLFCFMLAERVENVISVIGC